MKSRALIYFILVTFLFTSLPAEAGLRLGIAGGAGRASWDAKQNIQGLEIIYSTDPKFALTGGAFLELRFAEFLGLEVGYFVEQRRFDFRDGPITTEISYRDTILPVLLRLWLADFFSIGVGGYHAKRSGGLRATSHLTPSGTPWTYDLPQTENVDQGFAGAVGLCFPMAPWTCFFMEGRLYQGLSGASRDATYDIKTRNSVFLLGFRFGS